MKPTSQMELGNHDVTWKGDRWENTNGLLGTRKTTMVLILSCFLLAILFESYLEYSSHSNFISCFVSTLPLLK